MNYEMMNNNKVFLLGKIETEPVSATKLLEKLSMKL